MDVCKAVKGSSATASAFTIINGWGFGDTEPFAVKNPAKG